MRSIDVLPFFDVIMVCRWTDLPSTSINSSGTLALEFNIAANTPTLSSYSKFVRAMTVSRLVLKAEVLRFARLYDRCGTGQSAPLWWLLREIRGNIADFRASRMNDDPHEISLKQYRSLQAGDSQSVGGLLAASMGFNYWNDWTNRDHMDVDVGNRII